MRSNLPVTKVEYPIGDEKALEGEGGEYGPDLDEEGIAE